MKKNLLLVGIIAFAFCYQACYEDKGRYDYLPSNKVTITIPGSLAAGLGDTLYYTPTITFADPSDTTGFEYWWEYKGNLSTLDHHDIICEGRELRFVPQPIRLQTVQFCVREIRTGTITSATMSVNWGALYAQGWLILREENGESKLSYVRPERVIPGNLSSGRVYVPYVDLYEKLFPGESLGSGPFVLRQAFTLMGSGGATSILYVIQENGAACLAGDSYAREVMLDQEFVGGAPPGLAPRDYYQGNFSSMLLNADGKAYYRSPTGGNVTVFFTYMFANFPMEYAGRVLKVDRIIPSVAENSFFFAVYDKDNKRFLFISAGSALANGIACPATITASGEYLDYNNTGDAEILYSAFYRESIGSPAYSITLYDKSGSVYVQTAQCTGDRQMSSSLPVRVLRHELFSGQAEISPDTKYWQLKTRDYLFFGTANRLYWYDHATSETHLFHTFPMGANVVDMDSNPQESELGVVLSNGSFVTLNIENARLMLDNNKIYEISVPGRIVDLEYKFPDYFTYASRQYRGD